jgi:hypothetical protein
MSAFDAKAIEVCRFYFYDFLEIPVGRSTAAGETVGTDERATRIYFF